MDTKRRTANGKAEKEEEEGEGAVDGGGAEALGGVMVQWRGNTVCSRYTLYVLPLSPGSTQYEVIATMHWEGHGGARIELRSPSLFVGVRCRCCLLLALLRPREDMMIRASYGQRL